MIRKKLAALALVVVLPLAACGTDAGTSSAPTSTTSTSATTDSSTTATGGTARPQRGGPGGGVSVSAVTTEEQLVALVQDAYGDAGLDLHRGHQPVQDVLDEVLTISHDELHVRMEEQGQNLADVATDLGIDPQTLVDALVDSRSAAVDTLLASGTITRAEADQYLAALEEAFSFRVDWNSTDATPSFTGLTT